MGITKLSFKGKVSDIQLPNTPIKVNFSVHPNQLKVTQAVQLTISEKARTYLMLKLI